MKSKLLAVIAIAALSAPLEASWFAKDGAELYLLRSEVETHRAVFDYPEDCQHVAKIMNAAEPLVRWYCK